jgi:3-hydroxyacyl-[acyl-carrier-protein] dehydratase
MENTTPDITSYIPQRAPFIMVETVLHADDKSAATTFTIRNDNIFVQDGQFTEPGLVENMAQTAAAGVGYKAYQLNVPPSVGYIGSLRNLSIMALPKVNDVLHTVITYEHRIMNVHGVRGEVFVGEILIASCEMKIFERE